VEETVPKGEDPQPANKNRNNAKQDAAMRSLLRLLLCIVSG
jgi:hypothetical protein